YRHAGDAAPHLAGDRDGGAASGVAAMATSHLGGSAHAAVMWAAAVAVLAAASSGEAAASGKFDGTYQGTMTGQSAAGPSHAMSQGACTERLTRSIAIAEGNVTLVYNPEANIVLTGTVGESGTFAAEAKRNTALSTGYEWTLKMSGSIVGDYLTGQIFAKTCTYRIQMRKAS
ncbi:MAG TPA: hypothetical protein VHT04_05970, partial [Stellaceae bacterium]|nr:hypothetical protein [Stellaceae bacterium]